MTGLPALLADGRRAGVAAVAGLALAQAGAAGAAAFATRDVFAALTSNTPAAASGALLVLLAAGLAIAMLRVAERTLAEAVGQSYAATLRSHLFEHVGRLPVSSVARRRSGGLALRFVGDLGAVRSWVSSGVARALSAAIVLPGTGLVLFWLSLTLAVSAAGPLLVALVLMAALAPVMAPLHRRLRRARAKLAADMTERLPVAPELVRLGRRRKERARLSRRTWAVVRAALTRRGLSASLRALPELGTAVSACALLYIASERGVAPADAAAALAVLGILGGPLRDLAGAWDRYQAWRVARDRCLDLLGIAPVSTGRVHPASRRSAASRESPAPLGVRFERVGGGVLRAVNGAVAPGEKVALVGPNGTGKSTLLAMAGGFEPCDRGATLSGRDGKFVPATDAPPGTALFLGPRTPILAGSLRRALSLGISPRPDDAALREIAGAYGLAGLVERLGGLDGRVSEAGRNLSVGEARRLMLVRAALTTAPLLLLDEPEKGLDADGRRRLARMIQDTERTVLFVTHDEALIRAADRLWHLQGGRLTITAPDRLAGESGLLSPGVAAGLATAADTQSFARLRSETLDN